MTDKGYKEELKEMSNAQLLNDVDDFFGFDPYYAGIRKAIMKELESRLNVSVDKFGHRFDIKWGEADDNTRED